MSEEEGADAGVVSLEVVGWEGVVDSEGVETVLSFSFRFFLSFLEVLASAEMSVEAGISPAAVSFFRFFFSFLSELDSAAGTSSRSGSCSRFRFFLSDFETAVSAVAQSRIQSHGTERHTTHLRMSRPPP